MMGIVQEYIAIIKYLVNTDGRYGLGIFYGNRKW
jgi:hypothetical protein